MVELLGDGRLAVSGSLLVTLDEALQSAAHVALRFHGLREVVGARMVSLARTRHLVGVFKLCNK